MTGYTCRLVEDKLKFEQFVWMCARAFGALAHMRDECNTARIKLKQELSGYELKQLQEAKDKLAKILALKTDDEKRNYAKQIRDTSLETLRTYLKEDNHKQENAILNDMIDRVKVWVPPSDDHNELKKFMLDQLTSSLHDRRYACNYQKEIDALSQKNLMDIYEEELNAAVENLQRRKKHYDAELASAKKREEWLMTLNESVPLPKELQYVSKN